MDQQKETKAMAPSFTPKNVKDLQAGDKIKVSGTETYRTITSVHRGTSGHIWLHFDELVVRRLANATVKVLNQQ